MEAAEAGTALPADADGAANGSLHKASSAEAGPAEATGGMVETERDRLIRLVRCCVLRAPRLQCQPARAISVIDALQEMLNVLLMHCSSR